MGSAAPHKDVHIVMCAIPAYGHIRPLRSLARSLAGLGYPITFITGTALAESVEAIKGVECVRLKGKADYDTERLDEFFPGRLQTPKGPERVFFDVEHIFFAPIPDQHDAVQSVLKRPELKDKKVVVIADAEHADQVTAFMGDVPMLLGARDTRRVPHITIGIMPLMMLSKDTAPFGLGLPSQGEEVNVAMNAKAVEMWAPMYGLLEKILEPYQCTKPLPSKFPLDNFYMTPDLYAQASVVPMEPPRRDLPSHISFIGSFAGANSTKPLPPWYLDFVVNDTTGRPLVLVTQGTLPGSDADELIMPTVTACKDLDVRVIVCGVEVKRPSDSELPANTRWAEWIAFEEVFQYTSLVVSNGGYGGILQAFAAGIPMVLAGTTEDKTETCLRGEMTGAAINLRTQTPTAEAVKDAVTKILADSSYKSKALGLKKAFAECDAVASMVSYIDELVAKHYP